MVVDYLLRTYSTDDIISKTYTWINRSKPGDRLSPLDYVQDMWTKSLRCATVYSEDLTEDILIEGLHGPIREIIGLYWSKKGKENQNT